MRSEFSDGELDPNLFVIRSDEVLSGAPIITRNRNLSVTDTLLEQRAKELFADLQKKIADLEARNLPPAIIKETKTTLMDLYNQDLAKLYSESGVAEESENGKHSL